MNRKPAPRRTWRRRLLLSCLVAGALFGALAIFARQRLPLGSDSAREYLQLLKRDLPASRAVADIPANTWVKLHQPWELDWRRQSHAGAAYDSARGLLLMFGSNTHGLNWDNEVHVFDPDARRWQSPYPASSPDSYRLDEKDRAIAGDDELRPWAMHTYDTVVYDAGRDALVVLARPDHNPKRKEFRGRARHLSWRYDLQSGSWDTLDENVPDHTPRFFAMSAAYDSQRDTLVVYGGGVWEMGPARDAWQRASPEFHHHIHHSLEYDPVRGLFAVFGDHRKTTKVWIYRPGPRAGDPGSWEEREPGGDVPPASQTLPVAYDPTQQLFLLCVDRVAPRGPGSGVADTYVYDVDSNRYRRLPMASVERLDMNYDMIYDSRRGVFLLVTGDWRTPPTVWALRLNARLLRD